MSESVGFSADAWRAAREPWTYTERGRTWVARPVSAEAVAGAFDRLSKQRGDLAAERREVGRLLRLAFPWRPSRMWRGDPVRRILALEPGLYQAVIKSFFASLAPTVGEPTPPTTHGSP